MANSEHEERLEKPSTPTKKPTGSDRIVWEDDKAPILIIGGIKKHRCRIVNVTKENLGKSFTFTAARKPKSTPK